MATNAFAPTPVRPAAATTIAGSSNHSEPNEPQVAAALVAALVERGIVSPGRQAEAVSVVEQALIHEPNERISLRRRLSELAGYVGGTLVVVAVGLLFRDRWVSVSVAVRVISLAVMSLLLLGFGVATAATHHGQTWRAVDQPPLRRRLASLLMTGGAVAAAASLAVLLDDSLDGGVDDPSTGPFVGVGAAGLAILIATLGYGVASSMLGQVAVAVGMAYLVVFSLDSVGDVESLRLGPAYLAVGLVWLALRHRGWWREALLAQLIGIAFCLVGAQIPVGSPHSWVGYVLTVGVAGGGFAVYVTRRAWPYLVAGVAGLALVMPEALMDWTNGSLGAAGALLASGVSLLAASAVGLGLYRSGKPEAREGEQSQDR